MILKLNFKSDTPIYQQICNQVIFWISTGKLEAGQRLPTVRGLAEEAGVNSMTVNKAYQQLKAEGYIVTDRRNGAMVSEKFQRTGELSSGQMEELVMVISKARIAGVTKEKFLSLCEELYEKKDSERAD